MLTQQVTCLPCRHLSRHLHPPTQRSAQRRGAVTRLGRLQTGGHSDSHLTRDLPRPRRAGGTLPAADGLGPSPTPAAGPAARTDRRPPRRAASVTAVAAVPPDSPSPAESSGRPRAALAGAGALPVRAHRHFRPAPPRLPAVRDTPPPQAAPAESRGHRPARCGGPTASIPPVTSPLAGCPQAAGATLPPAPRRGLPPGTADGGTARPRSPPPVRIPQRHKQRRRRAETAAGGTAAARALPDG